MSGKGNCYDNAMVETFFKTLKSELVWRTVFYTRHEADQAIGRYIDGFYNPIQAPSRPRLHQPGSVSKTCRQMSQRLSTKPTQVHLQLVDRPVDLLAECHRIELVLHGAMETLADAVGLRALGLRPGVVDGLDRQVEFVLMVSPPQNSVPRSVASVQAAAVLVIERKDTVR